ncbi:hypothetical protein [Sphingomonas crocodyli]|uniref:Arylmalonate decarboxylase n=1 Tax=Sphingomonas crocodyli TaxID=1979270 RepID=A0A437M0E4_9SPHN|nr:hypothetical protein [Sphingomonas crocodyli]RVT90984.1 hypothetical protein EOD43_15745 [Sphingomonas crocodyli]
MNPVREYGAAGRVGIAVPQANPVVEPEMGALMPAGVSVIASRLTSAEEDQRTRFTAYFEQLGETLKSYDTLRLDALGFACTASSYLVGAAREEELAAELSAHVGYPIVTGAQAILAAFARLDIRRVVVIAPYPQFVLDAGGDYFRAAGIEILAKHRVATRTSDTRTIYELTGDDAIAAAESIDLTGADALLFTGTGMPSLRAIDTLGARTGIPILSTNLCLAWALATRIGADMADGPHPLFNGWQDRIARL